MTNQLASASAGTPDNTEVVVKKLLDEAKRDEEYVLARKNVERLEAELKAANEKVTSLNKDVSEMLGDIDAAIAALKATPEEIALIDRATDKFAAKLAFINTSRQKANASVNEDEVKTLREENSKLRASIREAEISSLFQDLDIFTKEELAQSLTHAKTLDEKGYVVWLEDKKLLAKKLKEFREKAQLVPKDGAEKLGGDGSELKRMGKGPAGVPLHTLAANLEELFTEVKEPDLGAAGAGAPAGENPMQGMVASLLPARRKLNKKD